MQVCVQFLEETCENRKGNIVRTDRVQESVYDEEQNRCLEVVEELQERHGLLRIQISRTPSSKGQPLEAEQSNFGAR
jgi:hypothetical protein